MIIPSMASSKCSSKHVIIDKYRLLFALCHWNMDYDDQIFSDFVNLHIIIG